MQESTDHQMYIHNIYLKNHCGHFDTEHNKTPYTGNYSQISSFLAVNR